MRGMLNLMMCCLFVLGGSAGLLNASPRHFEKGVVVGVQKYQPDRPRYDKRTSAPARASEYDYDISIQLDCSVYVARFQSPVDYLPSAFKPHQAIEVSIGKHRVYAKDAVEGEIRMAIVRHYDASESPCPSGTQSD